MDEKELKDQIEQLQSQIKTMSLAMESDRTKLAVALTAIDKAMNSRSGLLDPGRGSYEWDDDRYREEFGTALRAIDTSMEDLRRVARDWTHCPQVSAEITEAQTYLGSKVVYRPEVMLPGELGWIQFDRFGVSSMDTLNEGIQHLEGLETTQFRIVQDVTLRRVVWMNGAKWVRPQ